MYESFYNLSGMPFQLTPDSRFFFGSRGHSKAIAHLNYGLAQGEGFIIITGEVGAGKTTLVEWLRSQMDPAAYTIARVNTTQVSENDLFRLAMAGFGLGDEAPGKAALLQRFESVLRAHRQAGRRCLLIVDEAQNLSLAALEELRMLSNVTVDGQTSLQTILLGQPQFRRLLASPNLDQLRQRVLTSYHLGPAQPGRDPRLYRASAARSRLGRRPALGRRRLRGGVHPYRRHSAPHQPALLAGAALRRARGKAPHHRRNRRQHRRRARPGSGRRAGRQRRRRADDAPA